MPENSDVSLASEANARVLEESAGHAVLLSVQGEGFRVRASGMPERKPAKPERPGVAWKATELIVSVDLPAKGSRELIIKLPSPLAPQGEKTRLLELDYAAARKGTMAFWSDYLDRGARFTVPEAAVNELFRANLFHALRLPRRHGGPGPETKIDLPYSNFAYDQTGHALAGEPVDLRRLHAL